MVVVCFWEDSFSVALVVLDQVQHLVTQHWGHLGHQGPALLLCHPHERLPVVLHLGPALHTQSTPRCWAWRSLLHCLCALGWQANQGCCSTASADFYEQFGTLLHQLFVFCNLQSSVCQQLYKVLAIGGQFLVVPVFTAGTYNHTLSPTCN